MDFGAVLSFGSFVILGAVLWLMGQSVKGWVRANVSSPRALRWYNRSIGFHAPLLALAAYQVPGFPIPDGWDGLGGRLLLGLACGMSTAQCHKAFRRALGVDSGSNA